MGGLFRCLFSSLINGIAMNLLWDSQPGESSTSRRLGRLMRRLRIRGLAGVKEEPPYLLCIVSYRK